ncbi:hypothetical protein [Streptomyces sp. NPDC004014]
MVPSRTSATKHRNPARHTAEPGTPDHDAMTLLDMTAPTAAPGQELPHTSP